MINIEREILFRGKRKDNGKWVCGSNIFIDGKFSYIYILNPNEDVRDLAYVCREVIPGTVGQYTGLTDGTKWEQLTKEEQIDWLKNHTVKEWNGKRIFEGDIVKHDFGEEQIGVQYAVVEYSDKYAAFMIKPLHDWMYCGKSDCEVIGNIHDNKLEVELLCNGEVNYGG